MLTIKDSAFKNYEKIGARKTIFAFLELKKQN